MNLTERDLLVVQAGLQKVPIVPEPAAALLWPNSESGRENMKRRLQELCELNLLRRHVAQAQIASNVALFYAWLPGMPTPAIGELAWALSRRWERLESRSVVFYTATEMAAKHYGRTIRNPLKATSALSHNVGLGQCYFHFAVHHPGLASAWVSEEVIASVRGYGEKVVDACIVDATSTPALAIEMAGASYAASNGQRLRDIHADCQSRNLPYEVWTIAGGVSL